MNNEITLKQPNAAELMRQATDVAGVCRAIVMQTACSIKGKKYVKIEGWQAISVANGCVLSARDVETLPTGIRAIGELRRIDSGVVIATAEGFVGNDENTWSGRDEYAKRAMAQTRAMSRAARSAFAHIVIMIDGNLSTTPAEEVPHEGFTNERPTLPPKTLIQNESVCASPKTIAAYAKASDPLQNKFLDGKWKDVVLHFGKNKGKKLGELETRSLSWYRDEWKPKPYNGIVAAVDLDLEEAFKAYAIERQAEKDRAEVVQVDPDDMGANQDWDAEPVKEKV
jgi:hypothetical protein